MIDQGSVTSALPENMRLLPVLDLKGGLVVRGVGGRRHEYRPIVSRLTPSCQPAQVARAFRNRLGLSEFYLADLDAIAGAPPALAVYRGIHALGCRLWVDAGVRRPADIAILAAANIEKIVAGLETLESPAALAEMCRTLGSERVAFSLDMQDGVPLGETAAWGTHDPWEIAERAIAAGVRSLIVLDLARVGAAGVARPEFSKSVDGPGTEELCRRLAAAYPDVELITGGGVRTAADVKRLRQCGVDAILAASALHDGTLNSTACSGSNEPGMG